MEKHYVIYVKEKNQEGYVENINHCGYGSEYWLNSELQNAKVFKEKDVQHEIDSIYHYENIVSVNRKEVFLTLVQQDTDKIKKIESIPDISIGVVSTKELDTIIKIECNTCKNTIFNLEKYKNCETEEIELKTMCKFCGKYESYKYYKGAFINYNTNERL